jgi:hypothetical protein
MLFSAVEGGPDIKHHPALYENWPPLAGFEQRKLLSLENLQKHSTEAALAAQQAIRASGLNGHQLRYVPLVGRERTGAVILNAQTLEVVLTTDAEPPR